MKLPKLKVLPENVTFSHKNFSQKNTPPKLQKIADWVLKLSALGLLIGGTMSTKPFASLLPQDLGITVMLYSGSIGTLFKNASKLFGLKTDF